MDGTWGHFWPGIDFSKWWYSWAWPIDLAWYPQLSLGMSAVTISAGKVNQARRVLGYAEMVSKPRAPPRRANPRWRRRERRTRRGVRPLKRGTSRSRSCMREWSDRWCAWRGLRAERYRRAGESETDLWNFVASIYIYVKKKCDHLVHPAPRQHERWSVLVSVGQCQCWSVLVSLLVSVGQLVGQCW